MAKTAVAQRAKSTPTPTPPKKSNAVAKLAAYSHEDYAGAGTENIGVRDLLIPRVTILQSLSPQINKKKAEYIEGAEIGDIADLGTNEVFKKGISFLPVMFIKQWIEWAPRSVGGLVRIHDDDLVMTETTKGPKGENVLPNGNYVVETSQFFGLNLTKNRRRCYIPMVSTQLKKARKWNVGIKDIRLPGTNKPAPMWYLTYDLTTGEESNNQGDWSGWIIKPSLSMDDWAEKNDLDPAELAQECVTMWQSMKRGEAKADTSHLDAERGHAAADDEAM